MMIEFNIHFKLIGISICFLVFCPQQSNFPPCDCLVAHACSAPSTTTSTLAFHLSEYALLCTSVGTWSRWNLVVPKHSTVPIQCRMQVLSVPAITDCTMGLKCYCDINATDPYCSIPKHMNMLLP